MFQFFKDNLRLGGVAKPRSSKWSTIEKQVIKEVGYCEACGAIGKVLDKLNVHHIIPFHEDPSKELERKNLIVLCRICHFLLGHLKNWKSFNVNIVEDASTLLKKIKNRP